MPALTQVTWSSSTLTPNSTLQPRPTQATNQNGEEAGWGEKYPGKIWEYSENQLVWDGGNRNRPSAGSTLRILGGRLLLCLLGLLLGLRPTTLNRPVHVTEHWLCLSIPQLCPPSPFICSKQNPDSISGFVPCPSLEAPEEPSQQICVSV